MGKWGSGRFEAGNVASWPARPRTLDEVRDSILGKLSAIARKRGLL